MRAKLKLEKEKRQQAENTIVLLSNQLAEFYTVENCLKLCVKYFDPGVLTIIKSHILQKTRNPHGYRYTNEIKQFALTIHFLGPAVYLPEHYEELLANMN